MTMTIYSFKLQDVFCDPKLTVFAVLLMLMILFMVATFIYGCIVSFRVSKMIARGEFDITTAFTDNLNFASRVFSHDSVRRPLRKGVVCFAMVFIMGILITLYCAIFLIK